jgi:hypothetical protein
VTADDATPDWAKVGGKVARFTNSRPPKATIATVERITATLIVLDDGSRWRKDGRPLAKSGTWSQHSTYLLPVGDQLVRDARAYTVLRNTAAKVNEAANRADATRASALRTLDEIERLVQRARSVVEGI